MVGHLRPRRTIHLPVTLSVVLMILNVALMVCWIVLLAQGSYWSALAIGTVLFVIILIGLVVYLILTIKEIRLNTRQANFVDSVTHELKSPIASLKLYLETLQLRDVDADQQKDFYRFMVDDLQRLDSLINQLLQVGRLDGIVSQAPTEEIAVEPLLRECAQAACIRHHQPPDAVSFDVEPAVFQGGQLALEMVFRNLLDNALKYSAPDPKVRVEVRVNGTGRVVTRVIDNGAGVPQNLRQKIFGLFYRGGNELERKHGGTGLGLYIVQTLVRKMRGRVSVHGTDDKEPGAVFKVELPGRVAECAS